MSIRKIFLPIILVLVIGSGLPPIGLANSHPPSFLNDGGLAILTTPAGFTIYAEIADTPMKKAKGLMYRTSLAPDRGMLFIFQDRGYWTFWMKNTKISLDMIWLDQKGKIVDVQPNIPICERQDDFCPRYRPRHRAYSVLELKAGQAKNLELKPGVTLKMEIP
jgi:uncharacterized membrane protein (UPF0127 family)